MLKPTDL